MNATSVAGAAAAVREGLSRGRVPLWLKVIYTTFMAILVPVYLVAWMLALFLFAYVRTDWGAQEIRSEMASS